LRAGVVLALFIPMRPPADLAALMTQTSTIIASEARHRGEVLRHGPSTPALHAFNAIYERIESPTDPLRHAGARSSYAVLPIFAPANAGVAINPSVFVGHRWLADGRSCARFLAPDFITAMVIQVGMGETGHIGTPAAYHLFADRPDGS
jgi:hypothetical protein